MSSKKQSLPVRDRPLKVFIGESSKAMKQVPFVLLGERVLDAAEIVLTSDGRQQLSIAPIHSPQPHCTVLAFVSVLFVL